MNIIEDSAWNFAWNRGEEGDTIYKGECFEWILHKNSYGCKLQHWCFGGINPPIYSIMSGIAQETVNFACSECGKKLTELEKFVVIMKGYKPR